MIGIAPAEGQGDEVIEPVALSRRLPVQPGTEAGWAIWGQKLQVLAGFEPANPEKLLNRLIVVLGRGVGGRGWDGSTVIVADGPSCRRAS